jgi:hypothetical protein
MPCPKNETYFIEELKVIQWQQILLKSKQITKGFK